jgi:tripartite-type tricarboxylate transporter receptor subunit TctC
MPTSLIGTLGATAVFGLSVLTASFAPAAAADFYQGKTLEVIVASGVGDSYDTLSRLVGRYIGRYLPGHPAVVIMNMPGAAGILAANQLYNLSPRDGTAIGMLDQSVYETQLFKVPGLKADVTKMNWIGRIISNNAALFAWHTAAVQNIEDAYTKELVVSSSGSASQLRWTVLKKLTGVKFKLITGYKSAIDGVLAMERGEVDAVSLPWTVFRVTHADWVRDKKVNVLLQTGLDAAPDLPGVPRVVDLARTDEQRQILELFSQSEKVGRSWTAPPGLPPQRVAQLRAAFTATLQDADFLADAARMQVSLSPLPGDQLQAIIDKSFDYAPAIVTRAQTLIESAEQAP